MIFAKSTESYVRGQFVKLGDLYCVVRSSTNEKGAITVCFPQKKDGKWRIVHSAIQVVPEFGDYKIIWVEKVDKNKWEERSGTWSCKETIESISANHAYTNSPAPKELEIYHPENTLWT